MKARLFLLQMDPELLADVDRIALALTIGAGLAVLLGALLAVVLVANLFTLRSLTKLMKRTDREIERLSPRLDPLIDRMTRLATDSQDITEHVRRGAKDLMATVEELNRSIREGSLAAQRRVLEFAAVLDIVKEEAEQVLMDTAATARGVSVTAEALRREPRFARRSYDQPGAPAPSPPPDLPPEVMTPRAAAVESPEEPLEPVVSSVPPGSRSATGS
ncbi:MAG: hypothetical protein ACREL7_13610 [Longimicrobiales bacterium]